MVKKKRGYLLLAAILSVLLCVTGIISPTLANPNLDKGLSLGNQEQGELLVKFTQNSGKGQVPELSGAEEVGEIPQIGVKIMKVKNPKAIAKLIEHNKHIEYAEANEVCELMLAPTDPAYRTYGSTYAKYINAEAGWDIVTNSGVTVAALDTGLNTHPDMPKPKHVYNIVSKNTNVTDLNGHGTLVSGSLCALANNGLGSAGVLWNYSNLMFVRVSEMANGNAYGSDIAAGTIYAADQGAKIITISYSGGGTATEKAAIDYAVKKGCVIFTSTGNDSTSAALAPANERSRCEGVIGVGALGPNDQRTAYSNGGPGLDILASGSWYAPNKDGGYSIWSGTSCASPVAAGIAALIWEILPDYTNAEIVAFLRSLARDVGPAGWDANTGFGVADMGIYLSKAIENRDDGTKPELPPVKDVTPPVLTLLGSASMTINRGTAFVEPGYRAIDDVDGDITSKVVVSGSADTAVVGRYTLTYTVSDAAGNTARATRTVNVAVPSETFEFTNKGKAGTSFTNSFTAKLSGTAVITMSGSNGSTQATVTVKNAAGAVVFSERLGNNASKAVYLAAGSYTATTKIETANGNETVNTRIVISETEPPPPPPRTAPAVKLVGSGEIVLHLGGSPYVEQGVTAADTVDGEIGAGAVITGNVDTSTPGSYTVQYSVTNSAGLSAGATRKVSVIAPEPRTVPGKSFSFAPKGKQGTSFTYSMDVAVPGTVALTASGFNKTSATVIVTDPSGAAVYAGTLSANAAHQFQAPAAGKYTVITTIDAANGNTSYTLGFATPGGTELWFPRPEIPR